MSAVESRPGHVRCMRDNASLARLAARMLRLMYGWRVRRRLPRLLKERRS